MIVIIVSAIVTSYAIDVDTLKLTTVKVDCEIGIEEVVCNHGSHQRHKGVLVVIDVVEDRRCEATER